MKAGKRSPTSPQSFDIQHALPSHVAGRVPNGGPSLVEPGVEVSGRPLTPEILLGVQRLAGNSAARLLQRGVSAAADCDRNASEQPLMIQRHASPEHLALGTISPNKLANIATAKDALAAVGKPVNLDKPGSQSVSDAIHLLSQERKRVRDWQQQPPTDETDKSWQLRLIRVDNGMGGAPVICTAGEMNTLADYFGSVSDIKAQQNGTLLRVLQTEREDYYNWLGSQLTTLRGYDYVERVVVEQSGDGPPVTRNARFYRTENRDGTVDDNAPYDSQDAPALVKQGFKGTMSGLAGISSPGEFAASALSDQHGADLAIRDDPGTKRRGTGGAWGAIARNACHFAPQSWYAWKDYHTKSRDLAGRAHDIRVALSVNGANMSQAQQVEQAKHAKDLENEAWLNNEFGNHYLQDSFASGHLINKTLIMQWFLEYALTFKFVGPDKEELARLGQMSAGRQKGISTPELYSKDVRMGPEGPQAASEQASAADEFRTAGLSRPGISDHANQLLGWLRTRRANKKGDAVTMANLQSASKSGELKFDIERGAAHAPDEGELREALNELVDSGLVYKDKGVVFADIYKVQDSPGTRSEAAKAGSTGYDPAKTLTLGTYHEFMNNAFLQSGAGGLHDYFCKQGLTVEDDAGNHFLVYGDNALLQAGAAEGVKLAAEQTQRSRNAIQDVVDNGGDGPDVGQIMKYFPSKAVVPKVFDGQLIQATNTALPLENFLGKLKPFMHKVFENYAHYKAARLPAPHARGGLIPKGEGTMSPHSGEEF